jgi:hypothetical protein
MTTPTSSEYRPTDKDRLDFANNVLFDTPGGWRFTQDSPILPNVWLAYAVRPRSQQELILTTRHDEAPVRRQRNCATC